MVYVLPPSLARCYLLSSAARHWMNVFFNWRALLTHGTTSFPPLASLYSHWASMLLPTRHREHACKYLAFCLILLCFIRVSARYTKCEHVKVMIMFWAGVPFVFHWFYKGSPFQLCKYQCSNRLDGSLISLILLVFIRVLARYTKMSFWNSDFYLFSDVFGRILIPYTETVHALIQHSLKRLICRWVMHSLPIAWEFVTRPYKIMQKRWENKGFRPAVLQDESLIRPIKQVIGGFNSEIQNNL